MKYSLLLVLASFLFYGCGTSESAQQSSSESTQRAAGSSENGEIKPFSEVITDSAEKDEGLFNVYKDDDKYFWEIPDSLFEREILTVSRIARTAEGIQYGGMKNNTQVLRWEKHDKKVLLRRVSFENTASDTLPIYEEKFKL